MFRILAPVAAVFLATAFTPPDAAAQNVRGGKGVSTEFGEFYPSISPNQLGRILSGEMGQVEVSTGEDTTLAGNVDGKSYDVYFYECDDGGFAAPAQPDSACLGFEYRAIFEGYPSDGDTVNLFNNDYHYGALWRDNEGDLSLQLNVIVEGGITEANIRITFAWWRGVLQSFDDFMAERTP